MLLLLATAAHAAPDPAVCDSWASRIKGATQGVMGGLGRLNDPRIRDLSGTMAPGAMMARVRDGACHIQSVGVVDLKATLVLDNPVGQEPLACPVEVRQAVVPLHLVLAGTAAAPTVVSSTLPLEALGPYLSTCAKAGWVQSAVLSAAGGWIEDRKPLWHRQLERWLAR